MAFEYRLKYYKDEDGEYTDYALTDIATILILIKANWYGDNPPKVLEIISILNEAGQSLLLEHYDRYVFDVYYLGSDTDYHFHKRSTLDAVAHSVDLFFSNRLSDLEGSLNQTKKENAYIRGDYFFKDHDYTITSERSFKEFRGNIAGLIGSMPLLYLGFFILSKIPGGRAMFPWATLVVTGMAVIFILLGCLIAFPGIFIHFHYLKENKDLTVRLTKGSEEIIIQTPSGTTTRYKKDIIKVTRFRNPAYKIPWSNYGYFQIEFKSGEVLNMTNLIVAQWPMSDRFSHPLKVDVVNGRILPIKKKTSIHSY